MPPHSIRANSVMITGLAACVAACAQLPTTGPASHPATRAAAVDPRVDAILTRLEQQQVRDLRARLAHRLEYVLDLPEDALTKRGELWFKDAEPVARFLIHFTEQVKAGRRDALDEKHMFDGRWYVEVQSRTKTVTRREVRRPEDRTNPYRVGSGLFALPFGQKKEDILREFEVVLEPPAADDAADTDHLKLTPRTGTKTGESYKELHFWVSRSGPLAGLPVKVRTAKLDGTGKLNSWMTITFDDVRLNVGVPDETFDLQTPAGFVEEVEELREAAPPEAR